jgi:hypothetical protein
MSCQIKIFLGLHLTKEIKMHLNQNSAWKELHSIGQGELAEVQNEEKEYIGQFIPNPLSISSLKDKEKEIKSLLQNFCPRLNLERHRLFVFTQLFIG